MGKGRVGQHGAVAEDLVEDVGLLQVVELVPAANEGGDGKTAISEQREEVIKGDEGWHRCHRPAGGGHQGGVDLAQLGDAVQRQVEACQPGLVFVAGLAIERRKLACNQDPPSAVLLVRVVDPALPIRLAGRVETCHECSHPSGASRHPGGHWPLSHGITVTVCPSKKQPTPGSAAFDNCK